MEVTSDSEQEDTFECKVTIETSDDYVNDLIMKYFSFGFKQQEILAFLRSLNSIIISQRTLKRILSRLGLHRRKFFSPLLNVAEFIERELQRSGKLHGYRWMHLKCLQNNLVVTQGNVREMLRLLDPEGHELRTRKRLRRRAYSNKGPNYLWHLDSYGKLKPFGICINGCIDGFSRHIIWLRVGPTSSDPKIIGGYYIDAIRNTGGCPQTIRSDMGTENKTVEHIQKTFNELFNTENSERPCYMYGTSPHNQRIEAWWGILRKHCAQFWMNVFHSLRDDGLFEGTVLDKMLIQFCFTRIIEDEMQQVVFEWNSHKISKTRNSISPVGKPTIMYELPFLYGSRNYIIPVPPFAVDEMSTKCTFNHFVCDKDFSELCGILIEENEFFQSSDPENCVILYKNLRRCFFEIFNI